MDSTSLYTQPSLLRRAVTRLVVFPVIAVAIVIASIACGPDVNAIAQTVTLSPGNNIQQAVNNNPPGTTFILRAGVYREQNVTLSTNNDGDSFIGDNGALMDGAKSLTNWTRVTIGGVSYWTTAGGTPQGSPYCNQPYACCEPGYPECVFPQDLYVDGNEYLHVASLKSLVPGANGWYWDFDGTDGGIQNNIYMAAAANPSSHIVEVGETAHAFQGTASDITIQNLGIQEYAAPLQMGAIDVSGPNWVIQNNNIQLNHGEGITFHVGADNIQILGNNVNNNGEMGIASGVTNGGLIESNYIAYNNADRVFTDFEGGGTKFVGNDITVSHNQVHDNYGVGLFSDANATYNTYDHNITYHNYGGGIRYEISRYGTITNNTVYGNYGKNPEIVYTGSDHGRISGNTVVDNGLGAINVWNTYGGIQTVHKVYQVTDTQVTGNTIYIPSPPLGTWLTIMAFQDFGQPPQPKIFSDPSNFFDYNTYKFEGPAWSCWHWGETSNVYSPISWSQWRGADGQDPHGTVVTNVTVPPLPK
jgi:parallel beta-helix repeat protein